MNCLSASEQWLTVSRRGWGQCDRNMANFLHPDKITLHRLSQWCAKVSWLNRICVLFDFPLAPIEVEFVSWRYLPTAEWMFVFRHLLGPSARNRKSCQVNWTTVYWKNAREMFPSVKVFQIYGGSVHILILDLWLTIHSFDQLHLSSQKWRL